MKENILREVYEDNLRQRKREPRAYPTVSPSSLTTSSRPRRYALVIGLLAVVMLAMPWDVWRGYAVPDPATVEPSGRPASALAVAGETLPYGPTTLLANFAQGTDSAMAWQRWVGVLVAEPPPGPPGITHQQEDGDVAYLFEGGDQTLSQLLGLQVRTIVIDPGHGGRDPGAVGPSGLVEKDINLAVALALRDRLARRENLYILLTREDDSSVSLRDRVSFANLHGADLLISIHVNSLAQESRPFVETFYLGMGGPTVSREQLALENRNSGYAVGEFRDLLERLDSRFRNEESQRLATAIQTNLFVNLRQHNSELLTGGLKTAPLLVLLGAEMPAVLVEITSLSNRAEEERLKTPAYRHLISRYLEKGILEYLSNVRFDMEGANHYASQEDDQGR